jgi:hypothetical protein
VAALELRDARLEDVRRRVHEAGVDVAEFLEREEVRRVLRVLELFRVDVGVVGGREGVGR